jgi:hypothetical protein
MRATGPLIIVGRDRISQTLVPARIFEIHGSSMMIACSYTLTAEVAPTLPVAIHSHQGAYRAGTKGAGFIQPNIQRAVHATAFVHWFGQVYSVGGFDTVRKSPLRSIRANSEV